MARGRVRVDHVTGKTEYIDQLAESGFAGEE
jgi:hypothetical protein